MLTIREVALRYGVSKSTMRRWIKECMPEIFDGKKIVLNDDQLQQLADYISKKNLINKEIDINLNEARISHERFTESDENASFELLEQLYKLKAENMAQREIIRTLEETNKTLVERLKSADKALEREQNMRIGFWSRLGQKLLGDGRQKEK